MLHAKMQKEVGTVHYKRSVFRSLAMVTQLGFSVLTPILLCVYTGYLVDSHFGTKLMVPMLILGVLAGGRCGWAFCVRAARQKPAQPVGRAACMQKLAVCRAWKQMPDRQ